MGPGEEEDQRLHDRRMARLAREEAELTALKQALENSEHRARLLIEDCANLRAELDNARRALNIHADAVTECKLVIDRLTLEGVKRRAEVDQLKKDKETLIEQRDTAYGRYDRAFEEAQRSNLQVELWKKYAAMLGKELSETAVIAHDHGWRSSRYEEGKKMREQLGVEPVSEKQEGEGPTDRPCCVEAYARGYAVGIARRGPSCSPSCGCNCHEEG